MRLADFVCSDAIVSELNSTDRDSVIKELVVALEKAGKLGKSKGSVIAGAVIKREDEASTGIGKGVAVPHVKHKSIKEVVAVIGCSTKGIDFSSLDKQLVYSVILLLSPSNSPDKHLQAMESIFKNLQKDDFRRFLRQSQTVEQISELLLDAEDV
jgi:nitrogen PTS system EIIA component